MKRLLTIPKIQMSLLLFLIYLSALLFDPSVQKIQVLLFSLIGVLGSDYLFLRLRKITPFLPSAAITSGLIIALLTSPFLPWYEPLLIGIFAMASKNFIRFQNRHVCNPAAFGLFLAGLFFQHNVSWWAVSFQQPDLKHAWSLVYFFLLIAPFWVSGIRMKRWRTSSTFLFSYVLLFVLFSNGFFIPNTVYLIRNTFFDPTVLFFSLVMLPEPMTTPIRPLRQVLFGLFVTIATIIVSLPFFRYLPDPFVFALLVSNIAFFKFK